MSGDRTPSSSQPTLYDPPEGGEDPVPRAAPDAELDLELPRALADQLSDVASHLGLSPSIVASRAVEMICEEIGLIQDEDFSSTTLIQKYQTRLDLLHALDYEVNPTGETEERRDGPDEVGSDREGESGDEDEDAYDWRDVDDIIGRVTTP
jgi:hypothetical protein